LLRTCNLLKIRHAAKSPTSHGSGWRESAIHSHIAPGRISGDAVTDQRTARVPQFFLTPGSPCPYLPGRIERKVFARLNGSFAQALNEALTHSGFRRSQMIAYRPACDGCSSCVSVRIVTSEFAPSRNQKRISRRNADLVRGEAPSEATREQFALLRAY